MDKVTFATFQRYLILTIVLSFFHPDSAHSDDPYLATISIERAADEDVVLGNSVELTLHVNDPDFTASLLSNIDGLEIKSIDETTVNIVSVGNPTVSATMDEEYRDSSFVVDFEEQPILDLLKKLRIDYGESPTTEEIVRFVYKHIDDKSYLRSFDLASTVAETGSGDCTEHAVLLTALARAQGFYARVVFGTLIIESGSNLRAYGHAWTEIHDGSEWQIMDATLISDESEQSRVKYVPITMLNDEGPGYFFSMLEFVKAAPSKITGAANLN